jgi:hypothetical protein
MFTTSYRETWYQDLITSLVRVVDPQVVVEIGTQQGCSACALAKGLRGDAWLATYDLFKEHYPDPPHAATHANFSLATDALYELRPKCNWKVTQGTASDVEETRIDLLHIDICNHYDNVKEVLETLIGRVEKMILLEGGVDNSWQKEHGFKSFLSLLEEPWVKRDWTYVVVPFTPDHAITICTRRIK